MLYNAFSIPYAYFSKEERGKEMEGVGKFRKREKPFTQISNHLLRDPNVSLKAKGLYSLIASYLSMVDFTLYKSTLRSNCSEGRDAFDKTWNELKNAGYLVQYKVKADKGQFIYEYELLDEPESKEQNEPKNKKSSGNNSKEKANNSKTNNFSIDNINELSSANSTYGFSVPGFPVNGNSVAIQDTLEKNNLEKNISLNNNSNNLNNSAIIFGEDVVVEENNYSVFNYFQEGLKDKERQNLEANRSYDVLTDDQFNLADEKVLSVLRSLSSVFQTFNNTSLFKLKDVALICARNTEAYGSASYSANALKLLCDTLNNISDERIRFAIVQLGADKINTIFNQIIDFYSPDSFNDKKSSIRCPEGYFYTAIINSADAKLRELGIAV